MKNLYLKKYKMPDKPGVYFFLKGKKIFYIGKATSLRSRVRSYFGKDLINTRGPGILDMVFKADNIKWQETDSVLEALILEAELIKKHQPYYNVKEKDDKSFNYVCITKEKIPKVLVVRGKNLREDASSKVLGSPAGSTRLSHKHPLYGHTFGPFTNGMQLREAMKIVRRIFPFLDSSSIKKQNRKFYEQLNLAPVLGKEGGLGGGELAMYKKNIANLILFFQGKKKQILNNLKKEMMSLAKERKFEEANIRKHQIFSLNHINDVALLKEDHPPTPSFPRRGGIRVESYDIAHMSGQNMVGVMVVVENGEANKSEYKKFIIRTQKNANDTGALEEVLSRRFRHTEWGMPDIVVTDGGIAQKKVAEQVLQRYQLKIPVLSVVKDDKHKARAILGDKELSKKYKREILLANSEAHRFAITFHKLRRGKNFIKKPPSF